MSQPSTTSAPNQYEQALARLGLRFIDSSSASIRPELVDMVQGAIPHGLGVLFAPPSAGKTALAVDLAACVALGRTWIGRRTESGPVIYVATEDAISVERRLLAKFAAFGTAWPARLRLLKGQFMAKEPGALEALADAMRDMGSGGLVVIDTLANAFAGANENDNSEMTELMCRMSELASSTGWVVLMLHHTTKASQGTGTPEVRGASAITGRSDFQLWCRHDKRRDLVSMSSGKLRDGRLAQLAVFRLSGHPMGFNRVGDPIEPVVATYLAGGLPFTQTPLVSAPKAGASDQRRLKLLELVGSMADGDGIAIADQVRSACLNQLQDVSPDGRRTTYSRLLKSTIERGLIELVASPSGQEALRLLKHRGETPESQQCFAVAAGALPETPKQEHPPSMEGGGQVSGFSSLADRTTEVETDRPRQSLRDIQVAFVPKDVTSAPATGLH